VKIPRFLPVFGDLAMTKATMIVLAMHGAPPHDFPREELVELFGLHFRIEHAPKSVPEQMKIRHDELDAKLRKWPRTAETDPYWHGSAKLAKELSDAIGSAVVVGFNEFCDPSIVEAIEVVVRLGAEKVIVVTPMMTQGGEHSEVDIPAAIEEAKQLHPHIEIIYAWPFDNGDIARFLSSQIEKITQ
jgi:sirohydrochlorin cobaltochelatase